MPQVKKEDGEEEDEEEQHKEEKEEYKEEEEIVGRESYWRTEICDNGNKTKRRW